MSKFLEFGGVLPDEIYDVARKMRQRRNKWLHVIERTTMKDAGNALDLAERMFKLTAGIELKCSPHLAIVD